MNNLKEIALLFESIENTQGTNSKKSLLKYALQSEYSDDLRIVLFHLFNPMISTGISKKSWNSANTKILSKEEKFYSIEELVKFVQENNTGKKETVERIKSFANRFETGYEQLLIYQIATKDINIGISTTTVSKYLKIPKFEIMLGERIDENTDFNREFILTKKLDGVNLTCFNRKGNITFFTRQGKEVLGLEKLKSEYEDLPEGVYFGEAIYSEESEAKDRKHLYRLSTGELNSKKIDKKISHWIFDYVSLKEWDSENFVRPYSQTINQLKSTFDKFDKNFIHLVPIIFQGTGKEKAFELLKEAKSKDWEGLVLRYSSSVYEKTRSSNFLKMKPFIECDLRIVGYKPYKHPGKLGAFICQDDDSNLIASVGSGYTDEQRVKFWENKDSFIGKIAEIQTMEITENKNGQKSLRFPVFLRIRDDKDITNIL